MKTKKSWWSLIIKDYPDFEPHEDTLKHIGEMIEQGYTQGELIQEEEETNERNK